LQKGIIKEAVDSNNKENERRAINVKEKKALKKVKLFVIHSFSLINL
jgi:hypothetical protein